MMSRLVGVTSPLHALTADQLILNSIRTSVIISRVRGRTSPCRCSRSNSEQEREVGEAVIIKPEGTDAESESWGLEDLYERPQVSRQTRMPNLMERKSTRRVETDAAPPTSVSKSPPICIRRGEWNLEKSQIFGKIVGEPAATPSVQHPSRVSVV